MKFKLDENFGIRTQQIFRTSGFNILTVRDQHLQGCADQQLYDVYVLPIAHFHSSRRANDNEGIG